MGCVSSKSFKKDLNRELAEANNEGKCINHIVSLTSSTYGLLNLENPQPPIKDVAEKNKLQSPEVIDACELMEGLEEGVPISVKDNKTPKSRVLTPMKLLNQIASPKISKKSGGKENRVDPFGSVLNPQNSSQISRSAPVNRNLSLNGTPVGSKRESFTRDGAVSSVKRSFNPLFDPENRSPRTRKQRKSREISESILNSLEHKCPPGGEDSVVIYTTTLRGIRKTFENCNNVRSIIESHDILVFERDISMDCGFKEELRKLMGTKEVRVPVVFVKGRMVGGAEEVVKLEEEGKLAVLFAGIPRAAAAGCEGCGGVRFAMCGLCSGSCKVLDVEQKKMVRCSECNENGLIHCPICSSPKQS